MKKLNQYLFSIVVVAILIVLPNKTAIAGPCELPDFDPANFGSPMENPYLPQPSSLPLTYVYEAEDEDGLIRNYIQFSKKTKKIENVKCIVVKDEEWLWVEEEEIWILLEETEDWHAWDNFGNFWYFGEWTTEYEYDDDWTLVSLNHDGSWEADISEGVFPGIILPYDPHPGDCYQQEYFEEEAEDVGKVLRLNAEVSVAYGDFEDCMEMKEWTALEPGNVEHKFYALGEGLVFIKELKEKTVEVELVDINNLSIPDPPDPLF